MNLFYRAVPKRYVRYWTKEAKACYFNGCRCTRCYIPLICETIAESCKMKYVVLELVKRFGAPKREDKKELL